jgi:methenyltetrahydrofolate cyclohydrolase
LSYFDDRPLRALLDELAARSPAPSGGAAAGWGCAIGAGLVEMAAAFGELDEIGSEARELRARALELARRDGEGFAPVLAALRLPRSDSERASRLAGALSDAAEAPLQIALAAARVAELAAATAREGKRSVRGDATAGAALAAGACEAAAGIVEENVGGREPPDPRVAQARDAVHRARRAAHTPGV